MLFIEKLHRLNTKNGRVLKRAGLSRNIDYVMDTGRFLNILNYKFQQISYQGAVGGLQ